MGVAHQMPAVPHNQAVEQLAPGAQIAVTPNVITAIVHTESGCKATPIALRLLYDSPFARVILQDELGRPLYD